MEPPDPIGPDPLREITPGGFTTGSPFARQFQQPPRSIKPTQITKPETVVDMSDLEEAHHRLIDLLEEVGHSTIARDMERRGSHFTWPDRIEEIADLIYRNLR